MNRYEFTVTRQRQWPEGCLVVEISQGGIDYTNPGALSQKYPNEFETFTGMTPAVQAAIEIYKNWKHDEPDEEIGIGLGCTGGNTIPFDNEPLTPEVEAKLLKQAREFDENLERCVQCGDFLGKKRYGPVDLGEYECCSENCAERYWESLQEEITEDAAEEDPEDDTFDEDAEEE
jgi:hypothetical protein